MHNNFVYLDEVIPGIRWDAKYATWDNFTGAPVDGYEVNRVVGTREMAHALKKVNEKAKAKGYGLLLWDGYRPQCAVDCFMRWAQSDKPDYTKEKHFPHIDKKNMFQLGYIAEKSGHSRGSTIDLTLFDLKTNQILDMGGCFDFMDEISHFDNEHITLSAFRNRSLLRDFMESCGFVPYEYEWWHFTLKNEPYPDTYFTFPITNEPAKIPVAI